MRRIFAVAMLLSALLSADASAASLDDFLRSVKRTALPNGLTLITREAPGTGVVAINTWVKAGYFHEPDEVAGMAHLFEHMFFKGSKNFPGAAQISEELASVGGVSNAGTIYDTTDYYFVLPKEGFVRGLEIQADAIANPLFDPAELKKESEVVIEESNRKYDNPFPVAMERMYATAFTQHRMKRWRIGSNEVLRNIRRENLLAFFETLYRPQNMVLVIAGDVTHAEALREVEKTFGKLPKGTLTKKGGPAEPPQTEMRFGQSSADLRQGYTVIGWHTSGQGAPDELALDLLSEVLGGGRSSRLFLGAVGPGAADTADAAHFTFEDVGVFQVQSAFDEKNRAETERRLLREVERLKTEGPTPLELQSAKNGIESGIILGLEDVLGQAEALGAAEVRGGYRKLATDLEKLNALTAQDLVNAARRYLTVENMTFYQYRPKGAPESSREAALAFVKENMRATGGAVQTASGAAPAAGAPLRGATGAKAPQQLTLNNGATLIVAERPGTPAVSVGVYFRGGRIDENSRNAGITQLLTRSLRRGTATRSGEEIDAQLEFLGTQIQPELQRDYFGLALSVLARNARPAMDILADVLLNPTFPEQGVTEDKHLQKAAIASSFDNATVRPAQMFEQAVFVNHPYALPVSGYPSSVDAIDAAALRDWWTKTVTADAAVIVIAGDIAAADARSLIETALAKLPRRAEQAPVMTGLPQVGRTESVEFRDRRQSAIVIGFPGVPMSHPDWLRLRLLQTIASGGSGTLFVELRSKRSLAYTVTAQLGAYGQAGTFGAYMATEAAKEEEAKAALLSELQRLRGEAVTDQNVARAKSYLGGITKLQLQTNRAQVSDLARNHFFGLPLNFTIQSLQEIGKLTAADVRAAATKYVTEAPVTAVLRGKAAK